VAEMTVSYSKLSKKDKKNLRKQLHGRDGTKCHYCGIEEGEFTKIWNKPIYKIGTRKRLEVEHKDGDDTHNSPENLVLACPICNIAKSDQFRYDEFMKVGNVIREIWLQRKEGLHQSI
jgi:5-methylcytosine-specific restriction endonuclease McrA